MYMILCVDMLKICDVIMCGHVKNMRCHNIMCGHVKNMRCIFCQTCGVQEQNKSACGEYTEE